MSAALAPATVSSADQLIQYRVNDSVAVTPNAPRGYIERYIHSEMYKRFPEVVSVIHSHSEDILPYTIAGGVPFRAVYHTPGFVGFDPSPIWDIENAYNSTQPRDMLVSSSRLGANLAESFASSANASTNPATLLPDRNLLLMRKHGFVTFGTGIEDATYKAVFATSNARVQTKAGLLQNAYQNVWSSQVNDSAFEALTQRQAEDTTAGSGAAGDRAWKLWVAEVESQPLYVNNVVVNGTG